MVTNNNTQLLNSPIPRVSISTTNTSACPHKGRASFVFESKCSNYCRSLLRNILYYPDQTIRNKIQKITAQSWHHTTTHHNAYTAHCTLWTEPWFWAPSYWGALWSEVLLPGAKREGGYQEYGQHIFLPVFTILAFLSKPHHQMTSPPSKLLHRNCWHHPTSHHMWPCDSQGFYSFLLGNFSMLTSCLSN